MKDDTAFDRKRRARDKANLRWLKNRHGLAVAIVMGGLLGATVAMSADLRATPYGLIAGALLAFVLASRAIARNWFS